MKRLLLLTATLAACNASNEQDARVERADSAGIEIVTSGSVDRVLPWSFERALEIGGDDGGPTAFFNVPPHGVAMDDGKHVYVLDSGNRRVVVFDSAGRAVRSLGREGGGPGEFRWPSSFAVDLDGRVLVHDFGHRAIIRFGADGAFIGQTPAPRNVDGRMHLREGAPVFAIREAGPDGGEDTLSL